LFNHESPRRGEQFVTRKITLAAARIKLGLQDKLVLGSLEASRDWGFAGDAVRALWLMLAHDVPDDYVVATGERHRIGEVVELAFSRLGLDWRRHVEIDPALAHADGAGVCGDSSKAERVLGWRPEVGFEALIAMMVDADVEQLTQGD
jgi:GDPmannose 4,6-dehydratase